MPEQEGTANISFKAWHIDAPDDLWTCQKGIVAMHVEGLQATTHSYWFPPLPTEADPTPSPEGTECHQINILSGRNSYTIKPGDNMKVVAQGITIDVLTAEEYTAKGYPSE